MYKSHFHGNEDQATLHAGYQYTVFHSDGLTIRLKANIPLQLENGDAAVEFTLKVTETTDVVLEISGNKTSAAEDLSGMVTETLLRTTNYWKEWVARSTYKGRWRDVVSRYGSIIAAPTFSLPETIGGQRNWDYRYAWIRDASFTVYSLIRMGYSREAGRFMDWVEKMCRDIKGQDRLGIMYSIDGNDAYGPLQLDIYGELMDSVYLYNKHVDPISYDFWKDLEQQVNWLANNWDQPDDGNWIRPVFTSRRCPATPTTWGSSVPRST